jgi:ribosomal protein L31
LISLVFLVTSALFFQTAVNGEVNMKSDIHPRYEEITARCSCGNEIKRVRRCVKTSRSMFAASATRSLPVSRKLLIPVVVLIASRSVSQDVLCASNAQTAFLEKRRHRRRFFCLLFWGIAAVMLTADQQEPL